MRTICLLSVLVLVLGLTSPAAPNGKPWFETGVVAASSPDTAMHNGLPNIVATPSGKLIAAWSAWSSGPKSKLRIVTAQSVDGGKTWSSPVTRIDNPGKTDADANFVVDGPRILLLSTTVPEPGRIIRTETWLTISGDDGEAWSTPVLARQPRKYTVGKVHVRHKLPDGRLAIGYSWDIFCEQDMALHTEGEMDLKSGFMFSTDGGRSWRAGGEVYALLRSSTTRLWEARS